MQLSRTARLLGYQTLTANTSAGKNLPPPPSISLRPSHNGVIFNLFGCARIVTHRPRSPSMVYPARCGHDELFPSAAQAFRSKPMVTTSPNANHGNRQNVAGTSRSPRARDASPSIGSEAASAAATGAAIDSEQDPLLAEQATEATISRPLEAPASAESHIQHETHETELLIPFSRPKTYVFHEASAVIGTNYQRRFETVVDILRVATEKDHRLRQNARDIHYHLRMCGPCEHDMHPSVLVVCRTAGLKRLDQLFRRPPIARQYLRTKTKRAGTALSSALSSALSFSALGRDAANRVSQYPSYDLYMWASDEGVHLLAQWDFAKPNGCSDDGRLFGADLSRATLCGAQLCLPEGSARIATAGCAIRSGNRLFCLTAHHGWINRPSSAMLGAVAQYSASGLTEGAYEDTIVGEFDNPCSDDDAIEEEYQGISYDLPIDEECTNEGIQSPRNIRTMKPDNGRTLTIHNQTQLPHREPFDTTIEAPGQDGSAVWFKQDLDWALLPISEEQFLPNMYWDVRYYSTLRFLTGGGYLDHGHMADVDIIVSQGRVKRGRLSSSIAFLGGINDTRQAKMWTARMLSGHGKTKALTSMVP